MKTPCPAFFLEPQRNPALPCVTVRPCVVKTIFTTAQEAVIELPSLHLGGTITRVVPFATLTTSLDKAVQAATEKIKALPVLDIRTAEKSASPEQAGSSTGASSGP